MSNIKPDQQKVRDGHCLSIFVSYELKSQLKALAAKYDRTTADMVRAVLRIGIPMMEGLSEAEVFDAEDARCVRSQRGPSPNTPHSGSAPFLPRVRKPGVAARG